MKAPRHHLADILRKATAGQVSPQQLRKDLGSPGGQQTSFYRDEAGQMWQAVGDMAETVLLLPDDGRNPALAPPVGTVLPLLP